MRYSIDVPRHARVPNSSRFYNPHTSVLAAAMVTGVVGLGLADGASAQQRTTTIWSATMTIGVSLDEPPGTGISWWGYVDDYEQWGSLEPSQFTHGGTTYTVRQIYQNAHLGHLQFGMEPGLPPNYETITLSLGSIQLSAHDASPQTSTMDPWLGRLRSLDWAEGQQVRSP